MVRSQRRCSWGTVGRSTPDEHGTDGLRGARSGRLTVKPPLPRLMPWQRRDPARLCSLRNCETGGSHSPSHCKTLLHSRTKWPEGFSFPDSVNCMRPSLSRHCSDLSTIPDCPCSSRDPPGTANGREWTPIIMGQSSASASSAYSRHGKGSKILVCSGWESSRFIFQCGKRSVRRFARRPLAIQGVELPDGRIHFHLADSRGKSITNQPIQL